MASSSKPTGAAPSPFSTETKMQRVARRLDDINHHLDAHDNLAIDFANELRDLQRTVAELGLQITYVMNQMQFKRKISAVADATGQIPTVTETLMERYRNGGREMLIAKMEQATHGQSDPAAGQTPAQENPHAESTETSGPDSEEESPTPPARTH